MLEAPGRGGKREGVGRKKGLSPEKRLDIGYRFEAEWNKLARKIAEHKAAEIGAKTNKRRHLASDDDKEEGLAAIHAIPANMIRKSDGRDYRELVVGWANQPAELDSDSWPDNIRNAVEALRHRQNNLPGYRRVYVPYRRPLNARENIASKLAKEFGVSVRFVRECCREWSAAKKLGDV